MKWSRIAPLRRPTKPKSDALRRAGARIRTHVGSRPALVRPAPTRQTDTKVRLNFLYPLTLPDSSERMPVAGKVVWVTPTGAQGNRPAGIGVQFPDTGEGESVRSKIETTLAGTLGADQPTQTM